MQDLTLGDYQKLSKTGYIKEPTIKNYLTLYKVLCIQKRDHLFIVWLPIFNRTIQISKYSKELWESANMYKGTNKLYKVFNYMVAFTKSTKSKL